MNVKKIAPVGAVFRPEKCTGRSSQAKRGRWSLERTTELVKKKLVTLNGDEEQQR